MSDENPNQPADAGGKQEKIHVVRARGDAETVPVFSCQILISREGGKVVAESANLAGISVAANNEREALKSVVDQLKSRLLAYQESGEIIPWLDPPTEANDKQQVRWMALHL